MNLIEQAIQHVGGVTAFTKAMNELIERPVTYQAVKKWAAKGRLPRTEWTGETRYADAIEHLTDRKVLREQLLSTTAVSSESEATGTAQQTGGA